MAKLFLQLLGQYVRRVSNENVRSQPNQAAHLLRLIHRPGMDPQPLLF